MRERVRAQFMLALYRSGRQADALEAYRSAREALVEQLGIEPGTELGQLHEAILAHDLALDMPSRGRTGLPRAGPSLPDPPTALIGRDAEAGKHRCPSSATAAPDC